jgi:hypothetical protein
MAVREQLVSAVVLTKIALGITSAQTFPVKEIREG